MYIFYWLFFFLILQRTIELRIAAQNEKWMKKRGGIELAKEHYKYFIILHVLFFLSIFTEVQSIATRKEIPFYVSFFIIFILLQIGRIWCIYSLGRFWNTKIIVLPKVSVIKKGPYKYIKHPNYIIVFFELIIIPLMFGAYVTAFIFPFIHVLLLVIRIPHEDKALGRNIHYHFEKK